MTAPATPRVWSRQELLDDIARMETQVAEYQSAYDKASEKTNRAGRESASQYNRLTSAQERLHERKLQLLKALDIGEKS